MPINAPTATELETLEALRAHRRSHRESLPLLISDHVEKVKAALEIELLHQKIDLMKEKELFALIKSVEALSQKLDNYGKKI